MNFLTAVIFSIVSLCTIGGKDIVQVTRVSEDYSASVVLNEGDVIYKLGDYKLDLAYGYNYNDAFKYELKKAKNLAENNEIEGIEDYRFDVLIKHQNQEIETLSGMRFFEVKDEENNPTGQYTMGITVNYYVHSFGEAMQRCWSYSFGLAWLVLKSLWQLVTFQIPINSLGGPVTTITTIATVAKTNFANLLFIIPLFSANLAIFNLLPIPALDGSHVMFTLIEWIRRKPISRKTENIIHTTGFLILLAFVVIVDILHFVL